MSLWLELITILVLVLINGLFAMSELAIVSSRRMRLLALERRGRAGAKAALKLADDPQRFLPTVQVGITLVGVLAGAFGGSGLSIRLGAWLDQFPLLDGNGTTIGLGVVVAGITFASLILGELVPKQLALRNPERVAILVAPFLEMLARVTAPVIWILRTTSAGVMRVIGSSAQPQAMVTDEEVKALVEEGAAAGVFEAEERQMITRVLRLPDRPVRSIMTPRPNVAWLDRADPPASLVAEIRALPHTRLVVCDGSLDNVVGVVRAKELLDQVLAGETLRLSTMVKRPPVLPDTMSVLAALEIVRSEPLGIAFVVDEYGTFEGVVTAADMLQAIVGEIAEIGENGEAAASVQREDGSWLMDGLLPVDEVRDRLGLVSLPEEGEYHTLAGLVLTLARRIPSEGDYVAWGGFRFEVVDMDGRRVDKVLVRAEAPVVPDV